MYYLYSVYVGGQRVHTDITIKAHAIKRARFQRDTLGKDNVRLTRKTVTASEWQRAAGKELGLNSGGSVAYVPFNSPLRGSL